jgi:hypothetical protein
LNDLQALPKGCEWAEFKVNHISKVLEYFVITAYRSNLFLPQKYISMLGFA